MIRHYLKLAKKTLIKNKYYTLVNVIGLVCGMLSVLVISKYVGSSFKYDKFHALRDRIYKVDQQETIDGSEQDYRASTYFGVGEIAYDFPEAEAVTRYSQHVESIVIADNDNGTRSSILEKRIFITDSSFLKVFTFPIIDGDRRNPLSQPNSLVITKSASRRYFGDASPVGKLVTVRVAWGEEATYQVTGLVDDVPLLSQFNFEFLIAPQPSPSLERLWDSPDFSTFILLNSNADASEMADKMVKMLSNVPELVSNKRQLAIALNSISSVKLTVTEYLLIAVGIFILIVCWINYINQVIAQSYWRIKEIEVFRVLGATRLNLQIQFIVDSALVCLFSLALVIGAYIGLEQYLLSLTGGRLLPLFGDSTPITWIFMSVFIAGILFAAAIQTTILVAPNFGTNLRSALSTRIRGVGARRSIVIIQFSISTILVICIFVVARQMKFLDSKDKGVDMHEVLVINAPMVKDTTWNVKRKRLKVFKQKCAEVSLVVGVASSATVPGEEYRNETYISLQDKPDKFLVHQNGVDDNYFRLYKVQFVAGRDFMPDASAENRSSLILNESAARGLGIYDFEKAVDTRIVDHEEGEVFNLIGIIKDYHQTALKYKMEPTAFKFNITRGHISLKIDRANKGEKEFQESINSLHESWNDLYRDASFDYYFLEQRFDSVNMSEKYLRILFYCFTGLSLIISCLGLFSMSLFISEKRQKEIGIRKVFGASTKDVLWIFFQSYLPSISIAIAIGAPTGYWLMSVWLTDYSYKFDIGFGLISGAIISVVVIFFLTVTFHTMRSATANPVKILGD